MVSVTVVQSSAVTVVQFSQLYYIFNVTHQATVIGRVQVGLPSLIHDQILGGGVSN